MNHAEETCPSSECPQHGTVAAGPDWADGELSTYKQILNGTCGLGYADCSLVDFARGLKYFIEAESHKPGADTHLIALLQRAACIGWELSRNRDAAAKARAEGYTKARQDAARVVCTLKAASFSQAPGYNQACAKIEAAIRALVPKPEKGKQDA